MLTFHNHWSDIRSVVEPLITDEPAVADDIVARSGISREKVRAGLRWAAAHGQVAEEFRTTPRGRIQSLYRRKVS